MGWSSLQCSSLQICCYAQLCDNFKQAISKSSNRAFDIQSCPFFKLFVRLSQNAQRKHSKKLSHLEK
jgi:hypothetical protein